MELLRLFTAGNVDDGKSTLIGRLLYDSNSISTDIIETLTRQSKTTGTHAAIDLALLTDGLRAEREQGITIDVAYKYFSTAKRKFIIADTPGHIQFTRNMFTGASNADAAVILVDARHGITEQTKRHSIISSIIGIPHVVVCINKMDLVGFSETVFNEIAAAYNAFAAPLHLKKITCIPVSALTGDNVVNASANMSWYDGKALLDYLETLPVQPDTASGAPRFNVQYVIRPQSDTLHDYRGYAGNVLSGSFKKGDRVLVLPSQIETTITKLEKHQQETDEVTHREPAVMHLEDDVDISRGSIIVPVNQVPKISRDITATLCWMDNTAWQPGQKLLLRQNSFSSRAVIKEVVNKIDIHSYEPVAAGGELKLNDISNVIIRTAENAGYDAYATNRHTGSFILVNEHTNNTVGAGVILE